MPLKSNGGLGVYISFMHWFTGSCVHGPNGSTRTLVNFTNLSGCSSGFEKVEGYNYMVTRLIHVYSIQRIVCQMGTVKI